MSGPLDGVVVLDLCRLLPGGFCTAMLGDLGADVIKIEQPGLGDYMRWAEPRMGAESAASWIVDRNKRSVALDLKDARAVAAVHQMAHSADVVIESFRPGVVDRLGVGYDALAATNPRIVYCSISGYGQDGPLAGEAGHDINYIARAGVLGITGLADGRPIVPGVQIADLAGGGLMAAIGVLAAVLRARATGEGDHIDVSMTDGAFALLSIHLGDYLASRDVPGPESMLLNGGYPCYAVYACADGRPLSVGALEERFFTELCDAVQRPDLADRQFDPSARTAWAELFGSKARDEWLQLLDGRDVCVAPVQDLREAANDPQLRARRMLVKQDAATGESHPQLAPPIKLRNSPASVRGPAPSLGEHTVAELRRAGVADKTITEMLRAGAAAQAAAAPG